MNRINWTELKPQIQQVGRLSLPAILTQITTIAMQYIDSAMVGALGANASAAIGLVSSTTWLLSGTIYAVSAGFSVQVAHQIGGNHDKKARDVVRHGIASALVVSAVLCLIGLLISHPLPGWLGGAQKIRRNATLYFMMFAIMLPFSQLNSLMSSFLQCSGDMVTPSILNAVMCVLDVIFNALLIPVFGVMGAGMGTMLACAVISLTGAWFCCVRNPRLRLRRKEKTVFDAKILKTAFKIGVPVAVQEIAMNSAMVAATMLIAPLGSIAIAANSFAVTAEGLCYMPGYGIGSAATTLVGRSYGAGNYKLAKRYGNICIAMGAVLMAITGGLMMIFCPFVFSILTPDPQVRSFAAEVLRIELLAEPFFGASIVAAGALRGTGDTFVPSLLNLGSIWVIRLGLAVLLITPLGLRGIIECVNKSLERLQCGYLDYLLLHRPDALMEPKEVADAFDTLYSSGKVRHFGVSNHNPYQIELLKTALQQPLEINQMQMSLLHTPMIDAGLNVNTFDSHGIERGAMTLDYCRLHAITMQCWSPFLYGMFEGNYLDNPKFPEVNQRLQELADDYHTTKAGIAIAWLLRHPANMQVVLGSCNTSHIKDIIDASD